MDEYSKRVQELLNETVKTSNRTPLMEFGLNDLVNKATSAVNDVVKSDAVGDTIRSARDLKAQAISRTGGGNIPMSQVIKSAKEQLHKYGISPSTDMFKQITDKVENFVDSNQQIAGIVGAAAGILAVGAVGTWMVNVFLKNRNVNVFIEKHEPTIKNDIKNLDKLIKDMGTDVKVGTIRSTVGTLRSKIESMRSKVGEAELSKSHRAAILKELNTFDLSLSGVIANVSKLENAAKKIKK